MGRRSQTLGELIDWLPLLSVDPGEEHVGLAFFMVEDGVWVPQWAVTRPPNEAIDTAIPIIEKTPVQVVAEQWRVYPGMAEWSECRTAEVIGSLRHLCRRNGIPFSTVPARAKDPARAWVRRNNMPLLGDTVHAKDAELIGWAFIQPEG